MSELYEKSLLKLELDRVLEMLSACATPKNCLAFNWEMKIHINSQS